MISEDFFFGGHLFVCLLITGNTRDRGNSKIFGEDFIYPLSLGRFDEA